MLTTGLRSFDVFAPVFVMTGGGPASATTTWSFYLYITAFERYEIGYASAMAVAVGSILFILLWLTNRYARSNQVTSSL
jgi:multiple sugar transport system permease protein